MKYKGCRSKRAYVNKNINAVASIVYGPDQMKDALEEIIASIDPTKTVSTLNDNQATAILEGLCDHARRQTDTLAEAKDILGREKRASDKLRKMIIAIMKYKFNMEPAHAWNWIIKRVPEVLVRMAPDHVEDKWLQGLYDELSMSEGRYIAQCLLHWEKKFDKKQQEERDAKKKL